MIVIKVELHSAVTGEVTQIAEGKIWNAGVDADLAGEIGLYEAEFTAKPMPPSKPRQFIASRTSNVRHNRADHVWHLVACALARCFP